MNRPEKFTTEQVWFWDTYLMEYSFADVIARLPPGVSIADVNVKNSNDSYEGKTSFTYTRRVENPLYEVQMKRFKEYRDKRIAELEAELDQLKVDE